MRMSNYTPGFVDSYDPEQKLARVRWDGIAGASPLPQAMLLYGLGDKSEHTDIRILPGDRVWLDFVNGDPRHPIVLGFRPKETDSAVAWRRLHADNIELEALDGDLVIKASGTIVIEGDIVHTGTITSNGKNIGSTHTHTGVDTGGGISGPPP